MTDASNEKHSMRIEGLDALRGLAILLMILSGSIPFGGALPAWMYHAQIPPPDHIFNPDLPGITWVDLVFPFFLFAMGAAFPLALSKKIDSGMPMWKLIIQISFRGLLLAFFAIFIQHTKPYALSPQPQFAQWITALLAFCILFFLFTRFSNNINPRIRFMFKAVSAILAVLLVFQLKYGDGSGFSLNRSDIIILVLANTAFFGSIIWIITRNNLLLRIGILVFLLALRLTHNIDGSWNQILWNFTPAPWLYKLYFLQYLFIVIPGTIAGDLILSGLKDLKGEENYSRRKEVLFALSMLLIVIITVAGLFSRQILLTIIFDFILLIISFSITYKGKTSYEKLLKRITSWGTYLLVLGFFFEAFEGGIKKDKSTLSYYFVTSGLAFFTYNFLSILFKRLHAGKKLKLITMNGQNPMIAYIAGSHFLMPVLALTSANVLLEKIFFTPWLGFIKGMLFTTLVALITSFFTRNKFFWRT